MFGFSEREVAIFRPLNSPWKIQQFLNKIPANFEPHDIETCFSPRMVLKENRAHCMEGAMFAATALRFHGYPPLVVDLTTDKDDDDHVITVFQEQGHWGAISKTNHAVLRYREPVYRNIRELVMSYFEHYYNPEGEKTLRAFSRPVNLSRFDCINWMTTEDDLWEICEYLCTIQHSRVMTLPLERKRRRMDRRLYEAGMTGAVK